MPFPNSEQMHFALVKLMSRFITGVQAEQFLCDQLMEKQCTYILTYESCSSAFTKRETARLWLWISQGLGNCGRSASSSVKELWSSCKVQNLEMFDGKKQVSSESLDVEF